MLRDEVGELERDAAGLAQLLADAGVAERNRLCRVDADGGRDFRRVHVGSVGREDSSERAVPAVSRGILPGG